MRPSILAALAAFLTAAAAHAADLTVVVRTADGQPVRDAVVTVKAPGGAGPVTFPWPYAVAQKDIRFNPFVLIVPVGAEVAFPNQDAVRHHVYSFSPVKKFELKLYGREEARTVRFDKPGIVPLGCNIHDRMLAYVVVVDTPFAAKTGPDGTAVLKGLPALAGSAVVWHPFMIAPKNQQTVPVSASGRQAVTVALRPAPPQP